MIRLAVRVRRTHAELVLADLLELAPAGVEEIEIDEEMIEYAVYGAPGELPRLPDLHAAVGEALVEVLTSEIPDDWQERWKQFHRPVLVEARRAGSAMHVRPSWEAPLEPDRGDVREIVIDPGQAFGTGGHASTRLCLELLLEVAEHEPPVGPLLDIGTGSGVLAIAAALLGFAPVLGLDNERESVEAAEANALANGVEIEFCRWDLRTHAVPWLDSPARSSASGSPGRFPGKGPPVVVANLLRPLLLELARTIVSPPAHLLAGGLLGQEVDGVLRAFDVSLGLRERARRESGEWAAVWLMAP